MTFAAALLAAVLASAGLPGRPAGPVLDAAAVLTPSAASELDGICRDLDSNGKGVLVVAMIPSLENDSIEGYANRLFKAWGIGSKEKNDGVLLLVSIGDRKVRIETGYGVEAILPDGRCGEIIRREIIPRFKAGDPSGGILAGARAIADGLRGIVAPPRTTQSPIEDLTALFGDTEDAVTKVLMLVQLLALLLGPVLVGSWWTAIPGRSRIAAAGLSAVVFGFGGPWLDWLPVQIVAFFVGCVVTNGLLHASDDRPGRRRSRGVGWSGSISGSDGSGGGFGGGGGGSFGGFSGGSSGGGGASGGW